MWSSYAMNIVGFRLVLNGFGLNVVWMEIGFIWPLELCEFISWCMMHGMVWFLCSCVEHSWCFDSSIYLWFMGFCGEIGWSSHLGRFVLGFILVFWDRLDRYDLYFWYAVFDRNRYDLPFSVSHFAVSLGQILISVCRNRSVCRFLCGSVWPVGLVPPNQGFSVYRWHFRCAVFGLNPDSVHIIVCWLIWFSRIRDFRSTGANFSMCHFWGKMVSKERDLGFRGIWFHCVLAWFCGLWGKIYERISKWL